MKSMTSKALSLGLATLLALGSAIPAANAEKKKGSYKPVQQSHSSHHNNSGKKIGAGIAAAAAAAIILSGAANASSSGGMSCRRLAHRCDEGERWACRKYRHRCE